MSDTTFPAPVYKPGLHPWRGPSVIVAEENDSVLYFNAVTLEAFRSSALRILGRRWGEGYWYSADFGPEPRVDLSAATADLLPLDSPSRRLHAQQVRTLREWTRQAEQRKAWLAQASRAIDEQDGDRAWQCLLERSHCEYEKVSLEPLIGAEGLADEDGR